ncbi:STAS domain-containing protein [Thermosipho ferrireducens]|uniref:Anti-sigma factor antagonist n=1 Tax=Thermosipho ferrireducens TaxID=2571116 RepID=A0ABX7S8R9_9BACT|nr:STAS domain-containing protein [Thermosipho ferrireducens]QTA38226.1 STAS domain-containing protein [Thermosipho ferrireducens]
MFDIKLVNDVPVVKIKGEIDVSNAPQMKAYIHENTIKKGYKNCVLDLTDMEYIDSSGLGILVGLLKTFKINGGEVVLANLNSNILHLLRMTNLDRVLNIKNSVSEAIKFLNS